MSNSGKQLALGFLVIFIAVVAAYLMGYAMVSVWEAF